MTEVKSLLRASMDNNISEKKAIDLTELVDREGRATLMVGSYKVWERKYLELSYYMAIIF